MYLARFFTSPPSLSTLENNKYNSHQSVCPIKSTVPCWLLAWPDLLMEGPCCFVIQSLGVPKECWLIGQNSLIGRKRSSQNTMQDSWIRWVKRVKQLDHRERKGKQEKRQLSADTSPRDLTLGHREACPWRLGPSFGTALFLSTLEFLVAFPFDLCQTLLLLLVRPVGSGGMIHSTSVSATNTPFSVEWIFKPRKPRLRSRLPVDFISGDRDRRTLHKMRFDSERDLLNSIRTALGE